MNPAHLADIQRVHQMNESPAIRTEVVSEVSFTADQLVELIRTHYGRDVIPHVKVEAEAIYGCGKLCHVKFKWTGPNTARFGANEQCQINVNGHKHVVTADELSYEDVIMMALNYSAQPSSLPMLSVTYSSKGVSGILTKGRTVRVTPGMHFDAYDTSNA